MESLPSFLTSNSLPMLGFTFQLLFQYQLPVMSEGEKNRGGAVVRGRDNPPPVRIGLTDLLNMGGGNGPHCLPGSGITGYSIWSKLGFPLSHKHSKKPIVF